MGGGFWIRPLKFFARESFFLLFLSFHIGRRGDFHKKAGTSELSMLSMEPMDTSGDSIDRINKYDDSCLNVQLTKMVEL